MASDLKFVRVPPILQASQAIHHLARALYHIQTDQLLRAKFGASVSLICIMRQPTADDV